MKKISLLFLIIIVLISSQCSHSGFERTKAGIRNGIVLSNRSLNLRIQFYADNIIRIQKFQTGILPDSLSLVVIQKSIPDLKIKITENDKSFCLASDKMKVIVSKADGRINYFNSDSVSVLNEKYTAEIQDAGLKDEKAFSVKQTFDLSKDEGIYGLGQHQYGYFNYRGKEVKLVQTNTDAVTPFLISTKGYGILWDNYSKTIFDDTKEFASLWSEAGNGMDYYFIYGGSMDNVIAGYRNLTGQAPLYGKWAYGYWQSKEHYENRTELLSIAKEFRDRKIPIDNIIQDWDYWPDREHWSQLFFDEKKYPNPKEMIDILHKENFHVMISIWTGLGPQTPVYKEMDKNGFLYKPVGWAGFKYYDAYNPAANNIYWKYASEGLFSKGIDGWWMDSTEPDIINALTKESEEFEMKRTGKNYLGSFTRYLNPYSLLCTESIYKHQRAETDKKRVYILTRSTFAGQQRAAATTWSGDIGADWPIYRRQISAGLNHCMSGIPYWTFDIGGFVIGSYEGVFSYGGKDPAYQELYTRMFQFGSFCPIFRSHRSETPREIWQFDKFSPVLEKFDNLRYRLMPYIYSLASQVTNNGYTIMRGLPMDFSTDKNTYSIDDQFMFGPALMVCPVTEYMYHRPPEKSVLVTSNHFKSKGGKTGLDAKYYKDIHYKELSLEKIDSNINVFWYAGRPNYVTDSTLSIHWEGKLIPSQTGKHQFHIKCFGPKRIYLDGKELKPVYTSTEVYTEYVNLIAGKEYSFVLETENGTAGALRVQLFWKTPDIFAKEEAPAVNKEKTRKVYLPEGSRWFDFWTGEVLEGGITLTAQAPIDKIPLYVKAGSIIPLGPFVQYASEKPADPLELRIYPGANGSFTLYEDENDSYNYEKGVSATIDFSWDNSKHILSIGKRKGSFPGMLNKRTFNVTIVDKKKGTDIGINSKPDKKIIYNGEEQTISF
jgi:alpha-D-xyloside xylohydrolase